MLIGINHRLALPILYRYRNDLVREVPALLRRDRLAVRFDGKGI